MKFNLLKKKLRGIDIIAEVTARFATMIEELYEGASNCKTEKDGIQTQIDSLHNREDVLNTAISQAETVARNLTALINK